MADTDDDMVPTTDRRPLNNLTDPDALNKKFAVPQELVQAGHPTNAPRDDSPESLDEDLTLGTNREDIDPQHSIIRPAGVETLDEDALGAD